jgi:hypothetical protein
VRDTACPAACLTCRGGRSVKDKLGALCAEGAPKAAKLSMRLLAKLPGADAAVRDLVEARSPPRSLVLLSGRD